jgi:hypothetical protein
MWPTQHPRGQTSDERTREGGGEEEEMKEVKQRNREVEEAEDDVKQGTYRRSAWSSRGGAHLKGGGRRRSDCNR